MVLMVLMELMVLMVLMALMIPPVVPPFSANGISTSYCCCVPTVVAIVVCLFDGFLLLFIPLFILYSGGGNFHIPEERDCYY